MHIDSLSFLRDESVLVPWTWNHVWFSNHDGLRNINWNGYLKAGMYLLSDQWFLRPWLELLAVVTVHPSSGCIWVLWVLLWFLWRALHINHFILRQRSLQALQGCPANRHCLFFSYTFPKAQIISSDPSADTTTFLLVYVATSLFFITEYLSIISVVFQTSLGITISIVRIQHYFLIQDWQEVLLYNFIQETQITITFHINYHVSLNDLHLVCLRYLPVTNKYH